MPAPVIIDFIARGMPDISRAFRSVEDTVTRFESNSTRQTQQGARQRQRVVDQEAKEKIRAYQKADVAVAQAQRAGVRTAEQSARADSRATERAAREKVQAMVRADRTIAQSRAQGAREAERIMRDEAKAAKQTADAQIREAKRASDGKAREAEKSRAAADRTSARSAAYMSRVRERSLNMADRYQDQQTKQRETARVEAGERRWGYARAAGQGAMQGVSTLARGAQSLAGTMTALGGGFTVADALSARVGQERQAAYLSNKSTVGGAARVSVDSILGDVKKVSAETGTDQDEVIKAWSSYVDKTGDFAGGKKNVSTFAKIAKATGASVTDVASSAGQLAVQNKGLKPAEMQQMLLDVVSQGRQGSVDMPELAKAAGKITKSSASYAGSQTDNQRSLLGLSQIAMRTSGSPEEAATVLTNISADAMKHNGDVTSALGKGTFNEKGQIASSPQQFIADVMGATGGNLTKIGDMKFGARSMKMFSALAPTFNDAESSALASGASKKDASAAGKAAVLSDMNGMIGAKYTEKDLNKDFGEIMKTSAEQFEGAVRNLKTEVGEKLVPELVKLVPVLQQLVPPLSKFLDEMISVANWAAGHPFLALTGLLTGSIMKSIVEAKIGDLIKNLISGGGAPVPGGGGGGAASVANRVVLPAITMGIASGAVITKSMLGYSEGQEQGADLAAKVRSWNSGRRDDRSVSPEEARKQLAAAQGRLDAHGGVLEQTANLANSLIGDDASSKDYKQYKGDQGFTGSDDLKKALAEVAIAVKANTAAQGGGSGPPGLNNPTQPISNRQPATK